MPSVKETYRVGLLSSKKIPKQGIVGTITATYLESVGQKEDDKRTCIVIEIDDGEYRIALNHERSKALAKPWGDESDEWVGKKVKVTKGKTRFGKDEVDCVVLTAISK